ncbi:MAG: type IV toxin-antitoxin system AbiEi family antitoxin domain-containing protein [Bacteroidales bacterium]|nr:type IV toxin-antitoxin system AbiEi family antitoxin domain-containing protein [Bacteroidales bacterium]
MIYNAFRELFFARGCFSPDEVASSGMYLNKNDFTRWCRNGWLVKLRNGLYTFPEYIRFPNFVFHAAVKMYPSYVSLHSALIYHGFISSQLNTQVSCVSPLKTMSFKNALGKFNYQKMHPRLLFGYEPQSNGGFPFQVATPEKALLDLFYLNPSLFDTEQGIRAFALEEKALYENWNPDVLYASLQEFENLALERRVAIFTTMYGL